MKTRIGRDIPYNHYSAIVSSAGSPSGANPFATISDVVASTGSVTLQLAYDQSTAPQILTSVANGAVQIKRGTAADTDTLMEFLNGAGVVIASVTGDGIGRFQKANIGDSTGGAGQLNVYNVASTIIEVKATDSTSFSRFSMRTDAASARFDITEYNSAAIGNHTVTSIPLASSTLMNSGNLSNQYVILRGFPVVAIAGITPNYGAYRLDNRGLGIDTNTNIHNSNQVNTMFSVAGSSYFGSRSISAIAFVHIAASTSAIPQMNLASGATVSAPVDGDIWNDSTQKTVYMKRSIGLISKVGFLSGATGDSNTVSGTTTLTAITTNGHTFTLPANSVSVGKRLRIHFRGRWSDSGLGENMTINFNAGATGTTIITTTGARAYQSGSSTNRGFGGWVDIRFDSLGAGGTVTVALTVLFQEDGQITDGFIAPSNGTVAFDTTIANLLQFSVQHSSNNAANSITFEDTYYEVLN